MAMRELAAALLALVLAAGANAADSLPAAEGDKTAFPTESWSEAPADDPLRVQIEGIVAGAFEG